MFSTPSSVNSMPASARIGIMCDGDSITTGTGSTTLGGYRLGLFLQLQAHLGYAPKMLGASEANSFVFNSCAVTAYTSAQLLTLLQTQSPLNPTATIHLIHICTNDVLASVPTATSTANVVSMIGQIRADNPTATIWVADIIDRSGFTSQVNTFNTALNTAIQGVASYSATPVIGKTMLIDMNAILGPYNVATYADVTHPNAAGYALMATGWYNQIITLF